jgi:hypothetical protein
MQQCLPLPVVGSGIDRSAVGLGEHEPVVLPFTAGTQPLLQLGCPVGTERIDQLGGQADRAAPCSGLRLDDYKPNTRLPLQCLPDSERPGLEIDVSPRQTQRLTLT